MDLEKQCSQLSENLRIKCGIIEFLKGEIVALLKENNRLRDRQEHDFFNNVKCFGQIHDLRNKLTLLIDDIEWILSLLEKERNIYHIFDSTQDSLSRFFSIEKRLKEFKLAEREWLGGD